METRYCCFCMQPGYGKVLQFVTFEVISQVYGDFSDTGNFMIAKFHTSNYFHCFHSPEIVY